MYDYLYVQCLKAILNSTYGINKKGDNLMFRKLKENAELCCVIDAMIELVDKSDVDFILAGPYNGCSAKIEFKNSKDFPSKDFKKSIKSLLIKEKLSIVDEIKKVVREV